MTKLGYICVMERIQLKADQSCSVAKATPAPLEMRSIALLNQIAKTLSFDVTDSFELPIEGKRRSIKS